MLATVKNHQHSLLLQERDDTWRWVVGPNHDSKRRSDRARHHARVVDSPEVKKVSTVFEFLRQRMGQRYGDRRLTDAAGTDDGHEAISV